MSLTSNFKEQCDCINNCTFDVHVIIQRKLRKGVINEADAEFLNNWLIRIQDETGVFEKKYKSANVNIYQRKCIRLYNLIDQTYPETQ